MNTICHHGNKRRAQYLSFSYCIWISDDLWYVHFQPPISCYCIALLMNVPYPFIPFEFSERFFHIVLFVNIWLVSMVRSMIYAIFLLIYIWLGLSKVMHLPISFRTTYHFRVTSSWFNCCSLDHWLPGRAIKPCSNPWCSCVMSVIHPFSLCWHNKHFSSELLHWHCW